MNISTTKRFNAPPDIVWEVMSDLENAADRIDAIVKLEILTESPVGKGTRFKETRIMFKKEATEEMEITSWNPPNTYTTEADGCGCHYTSVITCGKDGDGTLVTMTFEAEAISTFGKVMSALTGWMMKSACAKMFDKDLENLKTFVESQATQPA